MRIERLGASKNVLENKEADGSDGLGRERRGKGVNEGLKAFKLFVHTPMQDQSLGVLHVEYGNGSGITCRAEHV